jgi:hypothetical protein
MPETGKRVYALADYTVECKANGWYFARAARFGERHEMKGPYASVASLTLMIARELKREISRRDERRLRET